MRLVLHLMSKEFSQHVRDSLQAWNESTESAIRHELAKRFDLGHSERLQFEIDPFFLGIHLIQTEETILEGDVIHDTISFESMESFKESGVDTFAVISDEIVLWFADRWLATDGPKLYSPAYVFFHGGLEAPRYDLEHRCWRTVGEIWPDE